MESLPNEVIAGIYAGLSIRDKIAFGSTCSVYRSFVPEGFPVFARKFSQVLAEINAIEYKMAWLNYSERIINGQSTYNTNWVEDAGKDYLYIVQNIEDTKTTKSQRCRYEELNPQLRTDNVIWPSSGVKTYIYMSCERADLPHQPRWMNITRNDPTRRYSFKYRVVYKFEDKLIY